MLWGKKNQMRSRKWMLPYSSLQKVLHFYVSDTLGFNLVLEGEMLCVLWVPSLLMPLFLKESLPGKASPSYVVLPFDEKQAHTHSPNVTCHQGESKWEFLISYAPLAFAFLPLLFPPWSPPPLPRPAPAEVEDHWQSDAWHWENTIQTIWLETELWKAI